MIVIRKEIGETPLEALEKYRSTRPELAAVPMTYAGRLDPMAEGELILLIGEECKEKAKYLGLDKEYEVEVVFGISTDTYDALGLVMMGKPGPADINVSKYVGKFRQEYPAYSSKTFEGKQLHELARADELPDEMPTKEVEIYSIDPVGDMRKCSALELKTVILDKINRVKGDFRQDAIKKRWEDVLVEPRRFQMIKIKVNCSSGTYMRSLAHRMGKDAGTGAFALSINRTKIFI